MGDGEKVIQAVFFQTDTGRLPVREWLKKDLTPEQRTAVGSDIKTVEFNWPVGMPLVRKLEVHLWEVRTHMESGIARVLFTVDAGRMVLLHGFTKKSQKTPWQDLEVARKRLAAMKGF